MRPFNKDLPGFEPPQPRRDYFAVREHRQEAERLALVLDGMLQSEEERTLADVAMIGILHALLSNPVTGRP